MTPPARTPPALRKDAYLQSLEKGLRVLEAFSAQRPQLSIADIAEATGTDRATARRALLTLHHMGYLRQDGKRFSLTARVLGFGYQYLAALPFWATAHPVMEELSDQLNETVSIGVLDGHDVVFILRVPAKRFLTFDPSIGSRVPAHLHSIGHVLLSRWSAAQLGSFLGAAPLDRRTPESIVDPALLAEQITQAGQQGWSFTARQYEDAYGGISVPLDDPRGVAMAGLNVSFIIDSDAQRRATEDILPRLKLAARRIQQSLG